MKTQYQKIHQMIDFMRTMNEQGSRQTLWHGIKLNHAAEQLKAGVLDAHTSHRYWPDGIRRKENDPLYESSFWMYGWSMTRKREYACSWGTVVFELDAEKIAQSFEVMPIAWNNLFKHHKGFQKKEFEEFVIAYRDTYSIDELKQQDTQRDERLDKIYDEMRNLDKTSEKYLALNQEMDRLESQPTWFVRWQEPKGKALDLNKCLKGIYINEYELKLYQEDNHKEVNENIQILLNHPKYKGVFVDPHEANRLKSRSIKA